MKILITGGAGYVGTELVKQVAANPMVSEVIVYDNLSRGNYNLFLDYPFQSQSAVTFVKGDILDSRKLENIMQGVDIVFHLAAVVTTPFANLDPHVYEQVNHWGTSDVAYAAQRSGVKKLIYLSSTSVYGATDKLITESSPAAPKTYYGMSKLRGESHLENIEMDVIVVRCGNVFGYSHSMRFDAVINRFAFEANYFNRITIQGDGKQSRAFIHIDTVSQVLAQLIQSQVPSGTYNLVENNYTVIEIVDVLKTTLPELEFAFVDQHMGLRSLRVDTNMRIAEHLTLPGQQDLATRLKRFLSHFSFGSRQFVNAPK